MKSVIMKNTGVKQQTGNFPVGTPIAGVQLEHDTIPFPVVANVKQIVNYRVFLYGETSSAFDFAEAINSIENAEGEDEVTIYLSGGGGCISSTDAFLHAIENAQARGIRVHCVASGLVASAHTFIILSCSSYECASGTHFLFHNGSLGDGGSYNQFKASSQFFLKYMETRFRDMYHNFLTEEELDDILEGKDMWLTADQFRVRYEQRNVLMEEEMRAEHEASDVAQQELDAAEAILAEEEQDESALPPQGETGWLHWNKPCVPNTPETATVDALYGDGELVRDVHPLAICWNGMLNGEHIPLVMYYRLALCS